MGCSSFANTEWHFRCIYTSYNRTHVRNVYIYIHTHTHIYIYIYIHKHRASGREPRSSGGNTSSNPQVSALVPRPVVNGMERMCQRHGSDQTATQLFESKNHVSINSYNITIYIIRNYASYLINFRIFSVYIDRASFSQPSFLLLLNY